jgi:hypothetical protein
MCSLWCWWIVFRFNEWNLNGIMYTAKCGYVWKWCPQMAIIGRRMISSDKPMCLWSSIVRIVLQIIVRIVLKKWRWTMIMNVGKLNYNNVIETKINNKAVSIVEGWMATTVVIMMSSWYYLVERVTYLMGD